MNSNNPHTYIQYLTKNQFVKTVQVDRQIEGTEIIYTVPPINEDFFVLTLFDLNKRVFGLTFANFQNLDNLGFLNSEFQSVDAIPENAFNLANSEISIVKDTLNYDINFNVIPNIGLKCSEYLFFFDYCLTFNVSFQILPFVSVFGESGQSSSINMIDNVIYFGSSNLPFDARLGYTESPMFHVTDFDHSKYLFSYLEKFGISQVIGYKAVFDSQIFVCGR